MYNWFRQMIKKIIFLGAVLVLALTILFVSIRATTVIATANLAAATIKFAVSPVPSPEASVSSKPQSSYFLAYPGILPDNPLYRFKMVRDRIWEWLTTGSGSRAKLFLLYADKRLGAGKALIDGNKVSLGVSTILKGEKYFERAILEAEKEKKIKRGQLSTFGETLRTAYLKYEEVLLELKEKASPDVKPAIDDLLKFLKSLQEKAAVI